MAQSGLKAVPASWVEAWLHVLDSQDTRLVGETLSAIRALPPLKGEAADRLSAALLKVADREPGAPAIRLEALAAVPGGLTTVSPEVFAFLCVQLDPDRPVAVRAAAVDVLSRAKLTGEQLLALTDTIPTVGPLEVNRLVAAFSQRRDEAIGLKLVAALGKSASLSTLRSESLKVLLAKFPKTVQEEANALYAKLDVDLAQQRSRLEQLLATLGSGDIRRGQAIFNSTKAACSTCHAIGYVGGRVGPDLTRIGGIRTSRDLLESITFPSSSFVQTYEPLTVATRDGKVHNGLLRTDSAEEVVLTISATEEVRIPRAEIEEMRPGTVSVMPAGLEQQLTPQELADLVAFLQACK
jgi:putative heme-binding domain-containing protein